MAEDHLRNPKLSDIVTQHTRLRLFCYSILSILNITTVYCFVHWATFYVHKWLLSVKCWYSLTLAYLLVFVGLSSSVMFASLHAQTYYSSLDLQPVGSGIPVPDLESVERVKNARGHTIYRCLICYRQFSTKEDVRRHIRVHSGERPFKCDLCDCRYKQKSKLNQHYRSKHGVECVKKKYKLRPNYTPGDPKTIETTVSVKESTVESCSMPPYEVSPKQGH